MHYKSLIHQKLVGVTCVHTFLVSRDLHRPLEAVTTDVTVIGLDREVRAANVLT